MKLPCCSIHIGRGSLRQKKAGYGDCGRLAKCLSEMVRQTLAILHSVQICRGFMGCEENPNYLKKGSCKTWQSLSAGLSYSGNLWVCRRGKIRSLSGIPGYVQTWLIDSAFGPVRICRAENLDQSPCLCVSPQTWVFPVCPLFLNS